MQEDKDKIKEDMEILKKQEQEIYAEMQRLIASEPTVRRYAELHSKLWGVRNNFNYLYDKVNAE